MSFAYLLVIANQWVSICLSEKRYMWGGGDNTIDGRHYFAMSLAYLLCFSKWTPLFL